MDMIRIIYDALDMDDWFSDSHTDEAFNRVMNLITKEGEEQGEKFEAVEDALTDLTERKSRLAFAIGLQAGMKLKSIEGSEFPNIEI